MPGWKKERCGGWGREADVNDCFYRFSIPELANYFALAEPMTREQWQARGLPCDFYEDPWSGKRHQDFNGTDFIPLFPGSSHGVVLGLVFLS